eukprot:CAMPEP_0168322176 /NCGR_PEP_ID=MMETSP0213-20121227/2728_1 /TAXON_ID=151035 /ORGANISM="Euplotes harpa, Strain FSP1.4" /LENGTH=80 /DNA_ID=CAMNT_0008324003 /DNA_START=127 /DNA_END=365 /DNA_ORIENTATION=-
MFELELGLGVGLDGWVYDFASSNGSTKLELVCVVGFTAGAGAGFGAGAGAGAGADAGAGAGATAGLTAVVSVLADVCFTS